MTPADKIRAKIASGGPTTFASFMETALYDPEDGYYASGRVKIGPSGDFITSPHVSALFGRCLARFIERADRALASPPLFTLIEGGPGEGKLAADILDTLKKSNPGLYSRLLYHPAEVSPALAARQRLALAGHEERLTLTPPKDAVGVYLSNELADALAVNVLQIGPNGLVELLVDSDGDRFVWREGQLSSKEVERLALEVLGDLPPVEDDGDGYRIEVCPGMREWLERASSPLSKGFLLTIDYGDEARRLYGPQRPLGTLRGFYGGDFIDEPLENPGEADLTASVDFTALRKCGDKLGLESAPLKKQWELLFALGITEGLEAMEAELADEVEILSLRQEVMPLIFPGVGMGESFKALIQGKGVAPDVLGL